MCQTNFVPLMRRRKWLHRREGVRKLLQRAGEYKTRSRDGECVYSLYIHQFIFFHLSNSGLWGCWKICPSRHRARGKVHLGKVASRSSRDRQPFTLLYTPTVNIESPINLRCMSLERNGGKLHIERAWIWTQETWSFLLWGNSADHCTTVLP